MKGSSLQGNPQKVPRGIYTSCVARRQHHLCLQTSICYRIDKWVCLWRFSCFVDFGSFWGGCISSLPAAFQQLSSSLPATVQQPLSCRFSSGFVILSSLRCRRQCNCSATRVLRGASGFLYFPVIPLSPPNVSTMFKTNLPAFSKNGFWTFFIINQ